MKRLPGWRARLQAAVAAAHRKSFAWGEHDCALFAADCVFAQTGVDLAASYRGTYSTAAGAMKTLKTMGASDLLALVADHLTEVHPSLAQKGDIAVMPGAVTGWALGVVMGERAGFLGPDGFGTVPLAQIAKAFRVG
ncbi:MAG: hypothetical protein J0H79_13930 [Alphaproteobacteria bacterium]|mgnify:CR=1 FL=1|nr:hypothetical protein [Alphaproteobacteria bacterium]